MTNPIWISGEIMADIGEAFGTATNEVEADTNAVLLGLDFGVGFNSLNLIPIVLDERGPDYKEIRRYHKKRRDFEFRLKISHAAFKAADALGQRRLIVENILRAVDEMKKMHVKDVDCQKLEQAIRDVAAAKGWLPALMIH
jgi:hypothetical protein